MAPERAGSPRLAKRGGYLLLVSFLLYSLHSVGQDSASVVVLPAGPLTYVQALGFATKQLNVDLINDTGCSELGEPCPVHGKTVFGEFFAPLKKKGLYYHFVTDVYGRTQLVIKRERVVLPAKPRPRSPRVYVLDEHGQPLPGAYVKLSDADTAVTAGDDGAAVLVGRRLPVRIEVSYVSMEPASRYVEKDSTKIVLEQQPQPLEEATVSYFSTTRALSTNTYTAIRDYDRQRSGEGRLTGVSNATLQTMLEGRVAGLLVTQSNGVAGSNSYLTVRGQSSIVNGTDPLYVIDGVPVPGNVNVSFIETGSSSKSQSPFLYIAPSDVERIDVLKDADATAIYGSRGANGVILISTRRWRASRPKWEVQLSTAISEVSRRVPFMDSREYLAFRREALMNSGIKPNDSIAPDLKIAGTVQPINWGRWLNGRAAPLHNFRVGLNGGVPQNSYSAGLNYLTESMPFPTLPRHERLNLNFNFNHRSTDRRWVLEVAGLAGWDWNHQFLWFDPTTFQTTVPNAPPMRTASGGLNFPLGLPFFNPMSIIEQPYVDRGSNYLFSAVTRYQLTEGLSFKTTVGINRIQSRELGQTPAAAQPPGGQATGYFAQTRLESRVLEPELEYRKRMGKLLIGWLGGASLQRQTADGSSRSDTGYSSDAALLRKEHAMIQDSSTPQPYGDTYTAFFSNLNVNWNNKYIVNLTARRDRSSRFPPAERWGNFGAVAAAWIFSKENAVRRLLPWLSFGKLKLSQGVTGNNQLGDRTLQNIAGTSITSFQSAAGPFPSAPSGAGKGWERTRKSELSLDLGILKNRLLFTATAYRHLSDNLLANDSTQAALTGHSGWPITLENRGFELSLSATLVDKPSLGWTVYANWSFPTSRLVSFDGLSQSVDSDRLVIGRSINVLKGYVYRGIDPSTGVYRMADLDGDGKITAADRRVVGQFDVTGFGGLDNLMRWKQFQLEVLIDARVQTGVNPLAALFANNPPGTIKLGFSSNYPVALMDHWRSASEPGTYQRLTAAPDSLADTAMAHYLGSSALFANASFLRLRKLSLAYSVPAAKLQRLHLSSAVVFLSAQNLFVLTPYKLADPETQSLLILPTMRTVEAGIRVSF